MPRFEATIRHIMNTYGRDEAIKTACRLCGMQRDEAKLYIEQIKRSCAADTIANHPSMKWDDT